MTTGTILVGSTTLNPKNYYRKTWSGTNGKYETVNGVVRQKYNTYSMTIDKCATTQGAGYNTFPMEAGTTETWSNNDGIKLLTKLSDKCRNTQFDLGDYIVEGPQTVRMVRDAILTVGKSLIYLKHGNFADAARCFGTDFAKTTLGPKDLTGRWLELQYGWRPIIDDVYSAMTLFEKSAAVENRRRFIRAATYRRVNFSGSASPPNYTVNAEMAFYQKIVYEVAEDLSTKRSLGLEDPASILWEGTPYSFVLDWFIPIGSYLSALNVIPLLKGRYCWTKTSVRSYPAASVTKAGAKGGWTGCALTSKHVTVSRVWGEGFSALNIPAPEIKTLSQAMSPLHLANALALVHQGLKGVRSPRGVPTLF
jgi:hypothetical protein